MSTYNRLRKDDDHRYTIRVTLVREGRPKYWTFYCVHCQAKICELDGEIIHMTDISPNTSDGKSPVVRLRCPGTKTWCRFWYELQLYN